jgi:hypothetical protein
MREDVLGSGGRAPPFLSSVPDLGALSASRPGCFTPGERDHGTYCIGGWVGSRAGLGVVEWRKISLSSAGNQTSAYSP